MEAYSSLLGEIKEQSLFAQGGKFIFHHFFHSAQGCFLLCGVASTHPAAQEVSSTARPLPLLLLPCLLFLSVSSLPAHGGNY